jgi:predicted nucleotide-binding protein
VCALLKGDIELPTDYAGVLYKPMDATGNWRFELAREIKAAGIDVGLNKLT